MSYFLAPAGLKLWQEVRESGKFPNRDSASDGWIGDTSHAARPSDHNPCSTCSGSSYGIVRAIDLDGDGWPAEACVQYLLARCRSGAEKRISYIIYRRRIWSVTYGWAQRYYSGINPHDAHFHVSLKRDSSNFSTASFLPTFPSGSTPVTPATPPVVQEDTFMFTFLYDAERKGPLCLVGELTFRPIGATEKDIWIKTKMVRNPGAWIGLSAAEFDTLKNGVGAAIRNVAANVDAALDDEFAALAAQHPAAADL